MASAGTRSQARPPVSGVSPRASPGRCLRRGVRPVAVRIVRRVGFEPTSPGGQRGLSPPCMPVPAPPRGRPRLAARQWLRQRVPARRRRLPTLAPMSRALLERRLTETSERLREARRELEVADEQLAHLADEADEARLRSLVSETPAGRARAPRGRPPRRRDGPPPGRGAGRDRAARAGPGRAARPAHRRPTRLTPSARTPRSAIDEERPDRADPRRDRRGRGHHPPRPARRPSRRRATRSWARPVAATRPSSWCATLEPDLAILDIKMPGLDGLDGGPRDHRRAAVPRC